MRGGDVSGGEGGRDCGGEGVEMGMVSFNRRTARRSVPPIGESRLGGWGLRLEGLR